MLLIIYIYETFFLTVIMWALNKLNKNVCMIACIEMWLILIYIAHLEEPFGFTYNLFFLCIGCIPIVIGTVGYGIYFICYYIRKIYIRNRERSK